MKRFTQRLKKIGFYLSCALLLGTTSANAATFTAVASGNFTSNLTWGGVAPSLNILGDVIIIPSGINVTLDQNVEVNGLLASFTVNGSLTSSNNSDLILTQGTLAGNGSIDVDSLYLALGSGVSYTGSIMAEKMNSMGATISSTTNITVKKMLKLSGGTLNMASGTLSLSSGAMIVVSGGSMSSSGGVVTLSNPYSVHYMSTSATAGLELTGSGLGDIDVNVPSGSWVKLSSDLDVNGNLMLTSGMFDLNGNTLTFNSGGNLSASGSGTITAMAGSGNSPNIMIKSANGLTGTLRFSSNGNTLNNLTINLGSSSGTVNLGSDVNVAGTLSLQSGMIEAGSNTITVKTGGSVTGGSSNSYVRTGNGGMLMMNVNTGASAMFHIGTENKYAPANVTSNSGSASGMIGVSAHNSVMMGGTTGDVISDTEPLVNATWDVTSSASSNINLNLELMWSADMEVNSFDRTKAFISHNMNGHWDAMASASATAATGGMFKISRNNITSLSPFAVVGEGADLAVNTITVNNNISVYPNPATDKLFYNTEKTIDKIVIYDITGRMVMSVGSNNTNTISVAELNTGVYYAHFYNGQNKVVQKFVKR